MVDMKQMVKGFSAWIDNEIIPPMMSGNPWSDMAVRGIGVLVAMKGQNMLAGLMEHPMVKMMGLVSEDGMVDIDTLKTVISQVMPDGLPVNLPGQSVKMTLRPADVDSLYNYIVRG